MNTEAIAAKIEDQLVATGRLAANDPATEQVVDALVTAIGPAIRQGVLELVEQAAAEVGAQLTTGHVDVVMSEGEPALVVRSDEAEPSFNTDELVARMTVRLPEQLKAALEEAADDAGDSVNSFVLKTLSTGTSRSRKGRRIRETFET
ncbi:MAG: toxin-antitoxin system HicB family antitoxin [Acidimicrobiia bacterium]|nr:toxin-antitoxin system HicB family antitoxin [Acidimicrobiia bacterium]